MCVVALDSLYSRLRLYLPSPPRANQLYFGWLRKIRSKIDWWSPHRGLRVRVDGVSDLVSSRGRPQKFKRDQNEIDVDAPTPALRRLQSALAEIWAEYQQTGGYTDGVPPHGDSVDQQSSAENVLFLKAITPLLEFVGHRFVQQAKLISASTGTTFMEKLERLRPDVLQEVMALLKNPGIVAPELATILLHEHFSLSLQGFIDNTLERQQVGIEFLVPAVKGSTEEKRELRRQRRKILTPAQIARGKRRQAVLNPAWKRHERTGKGKTATLRDLRIPFTTYQDYYLGITDRPPGFLDRLLKELQIKSKNLK
jgi:hypothetical protein